MRKSITEACARRNTIRDGHSAVGNNFYNLEPWIFSVMLMEICSQLQFPLTK
jgi:hypothetical protein